MVIKKQAKDSIPATSKTFKAGFWHRLICNHDYQIMKDDFLSQSLRCIKCLRFKYELRI